MKYDKRTFADELINEDPNLKVDLDAWVAGKEDEEAEQAYKVWIKHEKEWEKIQQRKKEWEEEKKERKGIMDLRDSLPHQIGLPLYELEDSLEKWYQIGNKEADPAFRDDFAAWKKEQEEAWEKVLAAKENIIRETKSRPETRSTVLAIMEYAALNMEEQPILELSRSKV